MPSSSPSISDSSLSNPCAGTHCSHRVRARTERERERERERDTYARTQIHTHTCTARHDIRRVAPRETSARACSMRVCKRVHQRGRRTQCVCVCARALLCTRVRKLSLYRHTHSLSLTHSLTLSTHTHTHRERERERERERASERARDTTHTHTHTHTHTTHTHTSSSKSTTEPSLSFDARETDVLFRLSATLVVSEFTDDSVSPSALVCVCVCVCERACVRVCTPMRTQPRIRACATAMRVDGQAARGRGGVLARFLRREIACAGSGRGIHCYCYPGRSVCWKTCRVTGTRAQRAGKAGKAGG